MRTSLFRGALLLIGLQAASITQLGAQQRGGAPANPQRATGASRSGRIEGDIFYLTRTGDLKRGAGIRVHLLRGDSDLAARLATNCARYRVAYDSLQTEQRSTQQVAVLQLVSTRLDELFEETTRQADALLGAASVTSVSAGIDAHYEFPDVPAGNYLLHARWPIQVGASERLYQWLSPATLTAGERLRIDLDTEAERSRSIYCGVR